MRNLNIDELNEVQGGKLSAGMAVSIINFFSDVYTLTEAAMKVDYASMASGTSVDYGGFNPLGDYTNGICAR
jgi:hypothetical protein